MCDHAPKLLGTMHFAADNAAALEADWTRYQAELLDLVRAKTGRDCEPVRQGARRVSVAMLAERAFGIVPEWCRRSIDRADPRELVIEASDVAQRPDGSCEMRITIFEAQRHADGER